jgi:UDP-2,4-diacetamido-2,4,6-trideoxy-beta-L-altropyranose hydrolase
MSLGNILIRADASSEIGTGHVMRCLAIAQAWQDAGGNAAYACRSLPASLEERLRDERIVVHQLQAQGNSVADAGETAAIALAAGADWIIVDGFDFRGDFLMNLAAAEIPIALIDDHAARDLYQGMLIIINPNIFASTEMYKGFGGEVLAGPKFALLRREFRSCRRRKAVPISGTLNLLISMGGSDPDNVTSQVLRALDHVNVGELEITIVVGGANRHLGSLKRAAAQGKYPVRFLIDVVDMPPVMCSAHAAISAPGGSAVELASVGTPMLLVTIAENHVRTAEEFARLGLASVAGWYDRLSSEEMGACIQQFLQDGVGRSDRALAAANRIDGGGAERVVTSMLRHEVTSKV